DRLHEHLHDVLPGRPPEQGGDRRAFPRHDDEPADRKMQDVRAFRPPLGFPSDHLRDLGLVEVRRLAGLRERLAALSQDHEGERGRDGATGAGISLGESFVDGSLADKDGTSCSIRSTASAKLLSGWRSIASMTTLPCPSSSQRSSLRAASSRLAIPSRRAQWTAATKAFLPNPRILTNRCHQ